MKYIHIPKLTRKQRVVRNLAVAALAVFLLAWMWDFPAWSKENLMRRVEREHLLEGSVLAHSAEDDYWGCELYIRNGERFMVATYSKTPLGLSPGWTKYLNGELYCTSHWHNVTDILALSAQDAAAAVITAQVRVKNSDGFWLEETYETEGQRLGEGVFRFIMTPHYGEEDDSSAARTERRLFDGELVANEWTGHIDLYDKTGNLTATLPLEGLEHDHWAW